MSTIVQYECTNTKCDFELRLSKNFPVWKEDTPKEYRKVPVRSAHQKYLKGSGSDYFCKHCKTVVGVVEPIWYPFPTFNDSPLRYLISTARRFGCFFGYYPKIRYICSVCKSVNTLLLDNEMCPKCHSGTVKEDEKGRVWF